MSPQLLTDLVEPVNQLYYGDGGTGKTTALMTMANLGKIWAVNAESGIKARALKKHGIAIENIEVYPGPGEQLTYDGLESEWLRIREELEKDPNAYAGTVWDSITEIHKVLLDSVVAKAQVRWEKQGKEREEHFIALEDYGVMTEQVRALMRKFRDLPCHFGVSALQRRDQDDDGSVTYQPAITPKLAIDLIGWMDVVCHTSVALVDGEEEFRGLFRPHSKFRGKDRLGALPKWLVDPTFERVVSYVDEDLTVDDDPVMKAARERAQRQRAKEQGNDPAESGSNANQDKKEEVTA